MLKNVSGQKVGAQLVSATDGSAFTGSVTVSVTVDAGTQATGSVGSGACTHEGNGYHTYAPAQAETNGDLIAFTFTGTGAVPATVQVYTLPTTGILAPTTAGRTLVVDAAGLADSNVVKVGPTGSGTAQTAGDIIGDTNDIQSRLPAALTADGNIKADTLRVGGTLQTAGDLASLIAAAESSLTTDIATLQTDATAILGDTNELQTDWTNGGRLDNLLDGIYQCVVAKRTVTVSGTPTNSIFESNATEANDWWNDARIVFVTGALAGVSRPILDYAQTNGTFTIDSNEPWPVAPSPGDTFNVVVDHVHPVSQIADYVWDELQSGHITAGSFGRNLDARSSDIETDTQNIQSRIPAALVSGRMSSQVAGFNSSVLTSTAIDASYVAAVQSGLSTHSAADVWAAATRTLTALDEDSTTLDLDATIRAALGMASASYDTDVSGLNTKLDAIEASTDTEIASIISSLNSLFTTAMTESYSADGATMTVAQSLYEIKSLLSEFANSGLTKSAKKLDGTTVWGTFTYDSDPPTSLTRTT